MMKTPVGKSEFEKYKIIVDNSKYRVSKKKRFIITTEYINTVYEYHVQEIKKFLFFRPKWKTMIAEHPCYNCGWGLVIFELKSDAVNYINKLKEIDRL